MLKRCSYIFIFISVFITVSHNIVPHHHHHEIKASHHDHDNDRDSDNNDHSIFSLGQLDETYLHSDAKMQVNVDFVSVFYTQPQFSFNINNPSIKQEYNLAEIYPPPEPYLYSYSFRGPPIS